MKSYLSYSARAPGTLANMHNELEMFSCPRNLNGFENHDFSFFQVRKHVLSPIADYRILLETKDRVTKEGQEEQGQQEEEQAQEQEQEKQAKEQ